MKNGFCEIKTCSAKILGCEVEDNCPAEHLCPEHYFALAFLEKRVQYSGGTIHGSLFSQIKDAAEIDKKELLEWRKNNQQCEYD